MKVLLATASYNTFFTFHRRFLSLAYIHAHAVSDPEIAGRCEIEHKYYDVMADGIERSVASIVDEKPDVLAFSCYSWNTVEVLQLIKGVRPRLPDCRIVIGGPEVGFHHSRILQDNPEVDVIVVGEGEEAFTEILHAYLKDSDLYPIRGLAFRGRDGLKTTPPRPFEKDLDRLPSPFLTGVFGPDELMGGAYWQTVRGCPFLCTYCDYGRNQPYYEFSLDRVEQEIDFFKRSGVRALFNIDPTFNFKRDRAHRILELSIEKDLDAMLWIEVFPSLIDEKLIDLVGQTKRIFVGTGLQTLNRNSMRQIKRFWAPHKVTDRLDRISALPNAFLNLELILGLPGDTFQDFKDTLDWAYDRRPNEIFAQPLSILPRTPMEKEAEQLGIEYTGVESGHHVIRTKECSETEIALGKAMLNWHHLFQGIFYRLANFLPAKASTLLEEWSIRSYHNGIFDLVDTIHHNRITPALFEELRTAFRDFVDSFLAPAGDSDMTESIVDLIDYIFTRRAFTEDRAFIMDILDINCIDTDPARHRIHSVRRAELPAPNGVQMSRIPFLRSSVHWKTYDSDIRQTWSALSLDELRAVPNRQTRIGFYTERRTGAGRAIVVDDASYDFIELSDGCKDLESVTLELNKRHGEDMNGPARSIYAVLEKAGLLRDRIDGPDPLEGRVGLTAPNEATSF